MWCHRRFSQASPSTWCHNNRRVDAFALRFSRRRRKVVHELSHSFIYEYYDLSRGGHINSNKLTNVLASVNDVSIFEPQDTVWRYRAEGYYRYSNICRIGNGESLLSPVHQQLYSFQSLQLQTFFSSLKRLYK